MPFTEHIPEKAVMSVYAYTTPSPLSVSSLASLQKPDTVYKKSPAGVFIVMLSPIFIFNFSFALALSITSLSFCGNSPSVAKLRISEIYGLSAPTKTAELPSIR